VFIRARGRSFDGGDVLMTNWKVTRTDTESTEFAPLESILRTHELYERPTRPKNYETENRALAKLVVALAQSPRTILQKLAEQILEALRADSAGISLLTEDKKSFYWTAIAGAWHPHIGGGTPRDFGPCGDVLDRNTPLLFTHPERRYAYLLEAAPLAEEALLVPFYAAGKAAVGTIWAIAHDEARKFDPEDLRQLESLGRFASAAYHAMGAAAALTRSHQMVEVQERERRRFARELHDEIGQVLASISLSLAAAKSAQPNRFEICVEQALRLSNELIERVRNLSGDLRPPMLDELGLLPTLAWHLAAYRARFAIPVTFKHFGLEGRRFSRELETAAYRIVQEALTNVAMHAGTRHAEVEVTADDHALHIAVSDLGAGFDPKSLETYATAGISGMRERAAMLGGSLTVASAPVEGTQVAATIPLMDSLHLVGW
jgi:signal transduction histidine kinase